MSFKVSNKDTKASSNDTVLVPILLLLTLLNLLGRFLQSMLKLPDKDQFSISAKTNLLTQQIYVKLDQTPALLQSFWGTP